VPASSPDARDEWSPAADEWARDSSPRRSGRARPAPVDVPYDPVYDGPTGRHSSGEEAPWRPTGVGPVVSSGPVDAAVATDDEPASDEPLPGEPLPEEPARPLPVTPARPLLSLGMAGLSAMLAVAMVVGAQLAAMSFALVILGVQVLFVIVATVANQPPGPRLVAAVGFGVAIASAAVTVLVSPASLASLAYVTVGGFVAAVVGQLLRPAGRVLVTEALGSSLVVVLGVISFATLIVLSRRPLGDQVIVATMVGAGAALLVAHLVDTVALFPRVAPPVARGGLGVVVGAMAGTAAAGLAGYYIEGLATLSTALAGLAAAVIALMVDLAADYAEAGRQLAGAAPALWLVRHMYGPLSAFALAAPTAYAASLVLARGL
jgi:hypothetical protein